LLGVVSDILSVRTNHKVNLGGLGARNDSVKGMNTFFLFNFGKKKTGYGAARKKFSEIFLPLNLGFMVKY